MICYIRRICVPSPQHGSNCEISGFERDQKICCTDYICATFLQCASTSVTSGGQLVWKSCSIVHTSSDSSLLCFSVRPVSLIWKKIETNWLKLSTLPCTSILSSPSTRARARGQKRTAMSVSSNDEESESTFVPPPAQRLRRRGLLSDITWYLVLGF